MPAWTPRRCSANAPRSASLAARTGTSSASSPASRDASGTSRHPRLGARWTKPSARRVMPTTATPTPTRTLCAGSESRRGPASLATSCDVSSGVKRALGRLTRSRLYTCPPSPTVATAIESTASSTASAVAPSGFAWTVGDGRPGPVGAGPARSSTRPRSVSSPSRSAMVDRFRPVVPASSDRRERTREVKGFDHRGEVVSPELIGGYPPTPAGTPRRSGPAAVLADERICWGLHVRTCSVGFGARWWAVNPCAAGDRRPPTSPGTQRIERVEHAQTELRGPRRFRLDRCRRCAPRFVAPSGELCNRGPRPSPTIGGRGPTHNMTGRSTLREARGHVGRTWR